MHLQGMWETFVAFNEGVDLTKRMYIFAVAQWSIDSLPIGRPPGWPVTSIPDSNRK